MFISGAGVALVLFHVYKEPCQECDIKSDIIDKLKNKECEKCKVKPVLKIIPEEPKEPKPENDKEGWMNVFS